MKYKIRDKNGVTEYIGTWEICFNLFIIIDDDLITVHEIEDTSK